MTPHFGAGAVQAIDVRLVHIPCSWSLLNIVTSRTRLYSADSLRILSHRFRASTMPSALTKTFAFLSLKPLLAIRCRLDGCTRSWNPVIMMGRETRKVWMRMALVRTRGRGWRPSSRRFTGDGISWMTRVVRRRCGRTRKQSCARWPTKTRKRFTCVCRVLFHGSGHTRAYHGRFLLGIWCSWLSHPLSMGLCAGGLRFESGFVHSFFVFFSPPRCSSGHPFCVNQCNHQ